MNLSNGEWEQFGVILPGSCSNKTYQLVFYWINDGSYLGEQPGAIVDNISVLPLDCLPVENVSTSLDITGAEPTLVVNVEDNNNIDLTYVLRYRYADNEWTEVLGLNLSDFPYSIDGLSYSATYEVEVATVCTSGERTRFIAGSTVTTPFTAPWADEFETDPFLHSYWSRYSGTELPATGTIQTSDLGTPINTVWNFNNSMVINGETSGRMKTQVCASEKHWLITPYIMLEEGTTYQISLDVTLISNNVDAPPTMVSPNDVFAVMVSTDGETWSRAQGIVFADNDEDLLRNYSQFSNSPLRCVYKLVDENNEPITGNVRFAVYAGAVDNNHGYNTNFIYIDNMSVSEWGCQAPYALRATVDSITTNSAEVTFIADLTSITQMEYVLIEGFDATPVDPETGAPVVMSEFTTSVTLTQLIPATYYTFAVRSTCTDAGVSPWSDPIVFKTLGAPVPVPYTTGFEDLEDNNTWNTKCSPGPNHWAIGNATYSSDGMSGNSAYISNDGGTAYAATVVGSNLYAALYKDFDFGEDPTAVWYLDFDYKILGRVYYETDVACGGRVYLSDPVSIPMDAIPSGGELATLYGQENWAHKRLELTGYTGIKRLIFYTWGYTSNPDVQSPMAVDNVSITVSNCPGPQDVTASNITSSSAEISWTATADSYIISYWTANDTEITTITAEGSPFTLSELTPATSYLLTVQSVCNEETSIYSDTINFTTACADGAITVFPWVEGFEGGVNCWEQEQVSGDATWEATTSVYGASPIGTQSAMLSGSDYELVTNLISPVLDLSVLSNATLTFEHMQPDWWGDQDELRVYYRTSEDAEPVLLAEYISSIYYWQNETFQLTELSSTFQLIFEGTLNYGYGVFLDNITISGDLIDIPEPCNAPTDLAVSAITQTEATVTWTGTATSYEIKLNGAAAETVTAATKTYTDLTPETAYTVEVRAVCETEESEWVSTQFSTLEEEVVVTPPTVATSAATEVSHEGATLNGAVTAGSEAITAKGFEYQAQGAATWEVVTVTGETLTTTLSGLTAETVYSFKAFATTASGNTYGETMTFTTEAAPVEIVAPTVTTLAATDVVANAATLNGTITAGNEEITSQGFMYRQAGAAEWTTVEAAGETIAATLTDLAAATTYNYKAFATTASGTTEGAEMSFTTLAGLADVANGAINAMIYPNPASDKATISVEGLNAEAQIVVSDAQGRILFNDTMNAGENTYELNTANYAAGVYYVRILSGNTISTQKLIVR